MWYAAGSPPSYAMAAQEGPRRARLQRAEGLRHGVGAGAVQDGDHGRRADRRLRQRQRDGDVDRDLRRDARRRRCEIAVERRAATTSSRWSSATTTPSRGPTAFPVWPETLPEYTAEIIELLIEEELLICGDPDEVLRQCKRWEQAGADQLSFGLPVGVPKEDTLQTIRLIGEHVIPKIDTDPVHRTTRFRQGGLSVVGGCGPRVADRAVPRAPEVRAPSHRARRERQPMLDHVIKGATVVDGTGAPAYTADVGIRDGRIAVIAARHRHRGGPDHRGRHRARPRPRLRRPAHPLRRPALLGPVRHPLPQPRRHHRRRRQLRFHARAAATPTAPRTPTTPAG